MKWIFIVSYCIMQWIPAPSGYKTTDEFGRETYHYTLELKGHYETVGDYVRKFNSRDSALAFYNRALNANEDKLFTVYDDKIDCVKFDSITVNEGREK